MSDERDEARWWIATPECGETSKRHIENLLARLSAVEAERDEAEANGETAMVQRDLAMARVEAARKALRPGHVDVEAARAALAALPVRRIGDDELLDRDAAPHDRGGPGLLGHY